MDIKEELLREHSKRQTELLSAYIGKDASLFAELMEIFFSDHALLAQRSAWVMSCVALVHPALYTPYYARSVRHLQRQDLHEASIRNILRLFQTIDIPDDLQGILVDVCLQLIEKSGTGSAIKAFSITILQNICRQYPEMARELVSVIRDRMEFEKPAYRHRALQFIREFDSLGISR